MTETMLLVNLAKVRFLTTPTSKYRRINYYSAAAVNNANMNEDNQNNDMIKTDAADGAGPSASHQEDVGVNDGVQNVVSLPINQFFNKFAYSL